MAKVKKKIDDMSDDEIVDEIGDASSDSNYRQEMAYMFKEGKDRPDLKTPTPENYEYLQALRRKKLMESLRKK